MTTFSTDKRIVYFHIPKCAGTSISSALVEEFGNELVLSPATVYDYLHTPANYLEKFKIYGGHINFDCLPLLQGPLEIFTVLRNPGRRLLSLYSYYQLLADNQLSTATEVLSTKTLDFHDWLESGQPSVMVQTSNAITRHFCPDRFFSDSRPAAPENILYVARNLLSSMAFVGFVEDPLQTVNYLSTLVSASKLKLANLNESASKAVRFDPKVLRNYLRTYCEFDLELIRYARDKNVSIPGSLLNMRSSAADFQIFEFFD